MGTSENVIQARLSVSQWRMAGAVVVVAVSLFYLLLFWNHFAGLRSGCGQFCLGLWMLDGWFPYRDYFLPSPPLSIFKGALVLSLLGKAYIVTRAFGLCERIILALLVYFWLARMFRVNHAVLAAIVTIVVSSGDITDPLDSYNHDAIMLAVASGFLGSYALDKQRSITSFLLLALLSGIFGGLCCATRQTIGFGISIVLPIAVCMCLSHLEDPRRWWLFFSTFAAGWACPISILALYLARLDLLQDFLAQLFVIGPAAKASCLGDFLTREIKTILGCSVFTIPAAIALLSIWNILRNSAKQKERKSEKNGVLVLVLMLGIASIGAGIFAPSDISSVFIARLLLKTLICFTLFASLAQFAFYGCLCFKNKLSWRESQFYLYAAVSFTVAFMLSLSFPLFEAMIVPGLGLVLAQILDVSGRWRITRATIIYAISALFLAVETMLKLQCPFGFAGFNEPPVSSAKACSTLPGLRGFLLPSQTVRFIDDTVNIIRQNSSSKDTVFIYPELALLYALSGRRCATFSPSHNMDVVNDELGKREAQRLLYSRPAVLIYYREPEQLLRNLESTWRKGRSSGNRSIISACEALAKEYHLAKSFTVAQDGIKIMVFVRPASKSTF